jgi:hypothetical protein
LEEAQKERDDYFVPIFEKILNVRLPTEPPLPDLQQPVVKVVKQAKL